MGRRLSGTPPARRQGRRAWARTLVRGFLLTTVIGVTLGSMTEPALAWQVPLCGLVPVLLTAELDRGAQARTHARLLEALQLGQNGPGATPWPADVQALAHTPASALPQDFLVSVADSVRRAMTLTHQRAIAGKAQATFTSTGIAELFSKRVFAEERLRSTITAELHDTVAQTLLTAQWTMEQGAPLAACLALVREAEEQLRAVMADTRPPELDLDLAASVMGLIDEVGARHGLTVDVLAWPAAELAAPSAAALTVYRFFQEALANVTKHSGASSAELSLTAGDTLRATVRDRGRGFDPQAVRSEGGRHVGLVLLSDRAQSLGGSLRIRSAPGTGATAELYLPYLPRPTEAVAP